MERLGIFAKYWQPGQVKTRLAADIGAVAASEVYRCGLELLTHRLQGTAEQRCVVFAPPERERQFAGLVGDDWLLIPQASGDLGRRMREFLGASLAAGVDRVVVIGSDAPTLPDEFVQQAFCALQTQRVVLGPAEDGGYYLIGIAGRVPPIFDDIAWSSPTVWRDTVERLRKTNTPFAQLPLWYDVDDVQDLRRLDRELQDGHGRDLVWGQLARAVERALEGLG